MFVKNAQGFTVKNSFEPVASAWMQAVEIDRAKRNKIFSLVTKNIATLAQARHAYNVLLKENKSGWADFRRIEETEIMLRDAIKKANQKANLFDEAQFLKIYDYFLSVARAAADKAAGSDLSKYAPDVLKDAEKIKLKK